MKSVYYHVISGLTHAVSINIMGGRSGMVNPKLLIKVKNQSIRELGMQHFPRPMDSLPSSSTVIRRIRNNPVMTKIRAEL